MTSFLSCNWSWKILKSCSREWKHSCLRHQNIWNGFFFTYFAVDWIMCLGDEQGDPKNVDFQMETIAWIHISQWNRSCDSNVWNKIYWWQHIMPTNSQSSIGLVIVVVGSDFPWFWPEIWFFFFLLRFTLHWNSDVNPDAIIFL